MISNNSFIFLPGSYKSEKPIHFYCIYKLHLKYDCINGSVVIGTREPILHSFVLHQPTGPKIYKEPKLKLFRKINESVLSHITFYLEDDDYKPVDFIKETITFTCQLNKLK